MSIKLTVFTNDKETFESYYYGHGTVIDQEHIMPGEFRTVIDYGDDRYHAEYQQGRCHSGLIPAILEES